MPATAAVNAAMTSPAATDRATDSPKTSIPTVRTRTWTGTTWWRISERSDRSRRSDRSDRSAVRVVHAVSRKTANAPNGVESNDPNVSNTRTVRTTRTTRPTPTPEGDTIFRAARTL